MKGEVECAEQFLKAEIGAERIIGGVNGDPKNDEGVVNGVALFQPVEGFVGFSDLRVERGDSVSAVVGSWFVAFKSYC